jgi:YebC/PmpR family DNA-binding regulatory protein
MGRGWVNAVREAAGAKKGKLFTKIAKEITVAVKMGGANAEGNPRLRAALKDAQKNSMPKDTIERAIKRGSGAGDEANFDEVLYEGYAPHGVAMLIEALTDNRNRTVQDLRSAFTRGGGNLGEAGSVQWMFERVGRIEARAPEAKADAEEAAIMSGANEVEELETQEWCFYTAPSDVEAVAKSLADMGWEVHKHELSYKPKTPAELNSEQEKDLQEFLVLIDDNEDVKRIHLAV